MLRQKLIFFQLPGNVLISNGLKKTLQRLESRFMVFL